MSPNQTPDPCRAEFEAGYFGNAPQGVKARERSGDGYLCMGPQAAWTTWQLAWKAATAHQASDPMPRATAKLIDAISNQPGQAWMEQFFRVAVALKCLPSSFLDGNAHVLRQAQLMAAQYVAPAQPDEWLVQDTRSHVGNDVLWWGRNGNGYTTDVSKAGVYTREEAFRIAASRGADRAWPKAYIDGKARPAVDFQHINHDDAMRGV